jgi:sugar-specific transcriptional regulator TrmB
LAVEDKEIAALRRLGLTEYESRVYLALIKMGPLKASEVGFFGQVPRTKTYGPIKELERKGLIHTMPGKTGLYAPLSPTEVLTPLVTKLSHEVTASESVVQKLALAYESSRLTKRDIPTESGEFWRIDGRGNVFKKLSEILDLATVSINYCTDIVGLIRAYNRHSDALEKASKKGAVVRMLSPISSENNSLAQEFSSIL